MIQLLPQERIQERIEEGIIDVPSSACGGGNDRGREAGTKFPAAVGGDLVAWIIEPNRQIGDSFKLQR